MSTPASLVVLIPSFNDWAALQLLLKRFDQVAFTAAWQVSAVIVDDASTQPLPDGWPNGCGKALASLDVLHLRSNLGHQRAIAIGLYHVHEFTHADAVAVMDGDGEDRVEDLPALLAEFETGDRREAVFAARGKRMESATFQIFYKAYRIVHRLFTGIEVRVGNFSILPREAVMRLMSVPDLWNHYAAAVYRARLPRRLLPLARGRRLAGESKMNFVSLLTHGLNAMSVFSEQVSARLLAATVAFAALTSGIGIAAGIGWLAFGVQFPSWMIITAAGVGALALQALGFATVFVFTIANRRTATGFILQRDAPYFILNNTKLSIPTRDTEPTRHIAAEQLQKLGGVLTDWDQARTARPSAIQKPEVTA
ncbi:MAG: glycosyltransferase [Acidobacteriota bacterium]